MAKITCKWESNQTPPKIIKNQHVDGPAAIDKTREWPSTCKNQHVDGQLAIDKKQRRTNANVYNHDVIQTYLKHPETNYIRTWSRVCGFRYGWNWFQVAFLFGLFTKGISKVQTVLGWMDALQVQVLLSRVSVWMAWLVGSKRFRPVSDPKMANVELYRTTSATFYGFRLGSDCFHRRLRLTSN